MKFALLGFASPGEEPLDEHGDEHALDDDAKDGFHCGSPFVPRGVPTFRTSGWWDFGIFARTRRFPGLARKRCETSYTATEQDYVETPSTVRGDRSTPANTAVLTRSPQFLVSSLPHRMGEADCVARKFGKQQGIMRNVGE